MLRNAARILALIAVVAAPAALNARSRGTPRRAAGPRPPASAPRILPLPASYRLPEGILLRYKAEWHWLTAGVASLRVERGPGNEERVIAAADAGGFVSKLYHVHDVYESSFDRGSFCSSQIHKHTEEGARRREQTITFDYAQGKSVRDELDLNKGQKHKMENAIPACATDVLSALFYAASLPLAPGQTYSFPLNDGAPTATIEVTVEGKEQIKTGAGTFNTIRVRPRTDSELLRKHGKVWVWYSDDAERLPVRMRGRMGWGTVTLILDRIERPATARR